MKVYFFRTGKYFAKFVVPMIEIMGSIQFSYQLLLVLRVHYLSDSITNSAIPRR